MDDCDVFISCSDSHSDGTHSLQSIHWWASDAMLYFSESVLIKKLMFLGWPGDKYIFSRCVIFEWTAPLNLSWMLQMSAENNPFGSEFTDFQMTLRRLSASSKLAELKRNTQHQSPFISISYSSDGHFYVWTMTDRCMLFFKTAEVKPVDDFE